MGSTSTTRRAAIGRPSTTLRLDIEGQVAQIAQSSGRFVAPALEPAPAPGYDAGTTDTPAALKSASSAKAVSIDTWAMTPKLTWSTNDVPEGSDAR